MCNQENHWADIDGALYLGINLLTPVSSVPFPARYAIHVSPLHPYPHFAWS